MQVEGPEKEQAAWVLLCLGQVSLSSDLGDRHPRNFKNTLFRWEGGSCLGMHVRIKDFKILKIKKKKRKKKKILSSSLGS